MVMDIIYGYYYRTAHSFILYSICESVGYNNSQYINWMAGARLFTSVNLTTLIRIILTLSITLTLT